MSWSSEKSGVIRVPTGARVQNSVALAASAWEAASAPEGSAPGELTWRPTRVPGTAAGVLQAAGVWKPGQEHDFDAEDWWFRTRFQAAPASAQEEVVLCLDGVATVADVYLNGELVNHSASMFERHALDVGPLLRAENELVIHCHALAPVLHQRRRPRARWRTRLVSDGNLRFVRTMLLGRAPGFAPGPAAVGPWRRVALERRRGLIAEHVRVRTSVHAGAGRLSVQARLRYTSGSLPTSAELELAGPTGIVAATLALSAQGSAVSARGEVTVPNVALWWPHTHGEPVLYDARLRVGTQQGMQAVALSRVGFRTITAGPGTDHELERDGLDLHINGVRVFCRGAVWMPLDIVSLSPAAEDLECALAQARDAGMNMLRVPGTSAYESAAFHDLCDELGMLVWQDFMFANLDYPTSDADFLAMVEREARQVLDDLGRRPSTAVLCGNSEIEQQVSMLGLDPALGRGDLFGSILPALAQEAGVDAVYVPSSSCGGERPFRPDRGVASYYGVGGYRRPLEDARRAGVRFAAECLAFANVPGEDSILQMLPETPASLAVHHPLWKAAVPRDVGSGWDFEDVRDHYLALVFGLDPGELRRVDQERYLELSRAVTGEVMAEVFGEWRRAASPCGGGIVLSLRDLVPGAGWGVIDSTGNPKAAYHHLARAFAPVALWIVDEGLAGMTAHVANDRCVELSALLRIALYRDGEDRVDEAQTALRLAPHSAGEWDLESLLGRFVDIGWAYRFGPPQHDVVVASLECDAHQGRSLLAQAIRFPAGRPLVPEAAQRIGLSATARTAADGNLSLQIACKRLAYGVRVHVPGFVPSEDAFSIEPGGRRLLQLRARTSDAAFAGGTVTAINVRGRVPVHYQQSPSLSNGVVEETFA